MTILAGKIPYKPKWTLQVSVCPEFMIDYTDRYAIEHCGDFEILNLQHLFKNFNLEIRLNDDCLLTHDFASLDRVNFERDFDDDVDLAQDLMFCLEGADVDNNFLVNNRVVTLGVSVNVFIEGIDLAWYFENFFCFLTADNQAKFGMDFMTENGCLKIPIRTPIYSWLMGHEQQIADYYSQKG